MSTNEKFKRSEELVKLFKDEENRERVELNLIKQLILNHEIESEKISMLVTIWSPEIKSEDKKYGIITNCVYDIEDINSIDSELYKGNLEKLETEITRRQLLNNSEAEKYVMKLLNHIELAISQKSYILRNVDLLKDKIKLANDTVDEIKDTKGKIYTEFIAILGIFTSIIFAVFGGFNQISILGSNISGTKLTRIFIFIPMIMLGINFLVFISFNSISKLISKNISSCGCKKDNCDCPFHKRHPSVFYSSLLFAYLMLSGIVVEMYTNTKRRLTLDMLYDDPNADLLPIIILLGMLFYLIVLSVKFTLNRFGSKDKIKTNQQHIYVVDKKWLIIFSVLFMVLLIFEVGKILYLSFM
ncbi:hypothetical protein [Macrococcus capreoli]|uniref:hypothetical protein n=1 Tax=Macrococcus capreoli TaxID=2982690 RepID=UPI003F43E220